MHIRRLGVLLVEIAIGSPVFETCFNSTKNEIEIDFDVRTDDRGRTRAARQDAILRRIRQEGSEDLVDVVKYCLEQGTAPEHMEQAEVEDFYDSVVEPLLLHYNKEVVEPERERQERRRAKKARKIAA